MSFLPIYLTNSLAHIILLLPELIQQPQLFAGVQNQPGLRDGRRETALFNSPTFMAYDLSTISYLFISDTGNSAIRRIDSQGIVGTLSLSANPPIRSPQGLALDHRRNLWVADSGNHLIRKINLQTNEVETVAGMPGQAGYANGTGSEARFSSPMGLAIYYEGQRRLSSGEVEFQASIIVADSGNNSLRRVYDSGKVETIFGGPSGSREATASPAVALQQPAGVSMDALGNIYVSEPQASRVKVLLPNGLVTFAVPDRVTALPKALMVATTGQLLIAGAGKGAQGVSFATPEIQRIVPERVSSWGGSGYT